MLSYEIITNLHETMIDLAVSPLLYKSYYLCLYRGIVELMTVYNRLRRSVWQIYSAYLLK